MKHIKFSKTEVLVDDLVNDEEDIPQFSYEFGDSLRIDLEEIQHRKEMKEWEAQAKNIENFHEIQYMMGDNDRFNNYAYQNNEEEFAFHPEFIYQDDEMLNDFNPDYQVSIFLTLYR